jgi:hypothetical protein
MMKAKEAMEILLKIDKDDEIIFHILEKSDAEDQAGQDITDSQWKEIVDSFGDDDNLNEVRQEVWEETIETALGV